MEPHIPVGLVSVEVLAAAPAVLLLLALVRRAGRRLLWGVRELLTSKSFVLSAGVFSLIASGAMLNSATTAYFTATQTIANNSFSTADVSLGSPAFVTFDIGKAVAGDIFDKQITLTNSSSISIPYYLSTFPSAASLLDSDAANGLRMVLFRCGSATAPVSCAAATTFETVAGVMDQAAATQIVTTGGAPTAPGISVSGDNLVFASGAGNVAGGGGAAIAGVPILTKNNPNSQGGCSTDDEGACLLGGYSGVTVNNPAITGLPVGSHSISIPGKSGVAGLGAGGGGSDTDRLLLYVYLPASAPNSFQSLTSTLTFAFTAVQPTGVTSAANGPLH